MARPRKQRERKTEPEPLRDERGRERLDRPFTPAEAAEIEARKLERLREAHRLTLRRGRQRPF